MREEKMELMANNFNISREDLPKGLLGEVMTDIVFCQTCFCRDKEAFLELVKETAKEIIEKVKGWLLKEIEKLPEKKYGERGTHYCTDANFLGGYGEAINDVVILIKKGE